jgi:hypothetical protein
VICTRHLGRGEVAGQLYTSERDVGYGGLSVRLGGETRNA